MRGMLLALAVVLLGGCTTSAVNTAINDASTVCTDLVPAAAATATAVTTGGAAATAAKVATDANTACGAVATAVANESTIDQVVSVVDAAWEDIFGVKSASTAAPAAATPAAGASN